MFLEGAVYDLEGCMVLGSGMLDYGLGLVNLLVGCRVLGVGMLDCGLGLGWDCIVLGDGRLDCSLGLGYQGRIRMIVKGLAQWEVVCSQV